MRLEIAAHSLIIQLEKSIKEIAIETGFTSAATFARAFKHYFGISAEKLRALPAQQRMALYKKGSHKQQLLDTDKYFKNVDNGKDKETSLDIGVKKIASISGIFTSS